MAHIDRSTITLRIFGSDLEPTDITRRLGAPPTAAAHTGATFHTSQGELRVVREGFWRLESGESDPTPLETKLRDLLATLTPDPQTWQDLTQQYRVDVFCGLFLGGWNEGFTLPPAVVHLLAERQLAIGFDIYGPIEHESEPSHR